ncbi:uncharacterized protein LY89DRAFT_741186 [Mollisia scopiformis]|uniref:Heterokaryon incompatibility domain-containing protein n=1 Tax=Mollisia scopiformis TaxID=149040 RepID=A0A132BBU5_MOLSC|nr:uncharacterized protein LY89DRAFT_741186 [Mollisia scopiformis]KUJ09479.1 hypothetical protein LY89DRAFT_741186 [Mollisia scopiformis]
MTRSTRQPLDSFAFRPCLPPPKCPQLPSNLLAFCPFSPSVPGLFAHTIWLRNVFSPYSPYNGISREYSNDGMSNMADLSIDPQLRPPPTTQPHGEPGLSARAGDTPDAQSDGEQNDGTSRKRQKLNLYKCNQCRVARKKCFPTDRVWPEKCQRCRQHKPELDCSEPQLNTRKRGPNLPKNTPRSKTRSSSEKPDAPSKESDDDSTADEAPPRSERPLPIGVPKRIKREHIETMEPVSETPQARPVGKTDQPPASVFLKLGPNNFRLLRLKPGKREDTVVCSFQTVSLDQPVDYEAISYFWGGSDLGWKDSVRIELEDIHKRTHAVFIRSNLCNALKSLRHPTEVRNFWVDALCINRSNQLETNHQVEMKLRIFHNAKNQCFWLGDDEVFKTGLTFITRILDLAKIDVLVRDPKSIEGWSAFVALLKNVAFSRLWMVQEVTVAKTTSLHCGSQGVLYTDFVDAVAMFISCRENLVRLFRQNGKDYRELLDRKITVTKRFIDVTQNTLRTLKPDRPDPEIERRLSLEALVSLLTDLTCTDPRDRIYSVLALAKDGLPPPEGTLMEGSYVLQNDQSLRIDYGRNVVDVYQDFVIHVIKHSHSLDIICRRWASAVSEKLPTWVRPLQSSLQLPGDTKSTERINADSLVGLPHEKCYSASQNKPAAWQRKLDPLTNSLLSLSVQGFKVDTITHLGPRASEGIIFYEWLELGGCKLTENGDEIPDKFWRALVGDRGPHCANAPSWYHRALLYCLSHSTGNPDINTKNLIAEYEAESSLVVDFLRRVQSVIWNRKFLVCAKNDWVGLAPMAAQIYDVVCILYGCSVPVLLRPMPSPMNVEYWSVVGECYVHGIMDGEAVRESTDPSSMDRDEYFELR